MADDQYMFQQLYVAYQETGDKIYRFAAEEITRLRAENEKLRKALAPFAANAKHFKDDCKDTLVVPIGVDVGYLRAAAAAL